ncbi:hypothetical protein Q31a_58190 [Aureliella helgolandensis]|uniref:Uncharacterized protein n=1 Tax=Aureliella helgolandensis TaxID=2527968 RepID=A0A518GFT5_9BACT|nr:hypothetical protein Q31a_58190 [Aureliella helgolandensis]
MHQNGAVYFELLVSPGLALHSIVKLRTHYGEGARTGFRCSEWLGLLQRWGCCP